MNSLNFNHLFYFWIVSKFESISKAADELNISSPSLSTQIKQLENNIGEELFIRSGRRIKLSDQGRELKRHCDGIFFQYDQLDRIIKEGKALSTSSDIKCGVSSNISKHLEYLFLSDMLNKEFNLQVKSKNNDELISDLVNFNLDFVLTNTFSLETETDLVVRKIHESPYVIARSTSAPPAQYTMSNDYIIQSCDAVNINLIRNHLLKVNEKAVIKSVIDDTSLLRLFGKKGSIPVVMPKIGLYDEIISNEIEILETLDVYETFYLVTTKKMNQILNLDYRVNQFNEKYKCV